jgi:serine/threonine-protein kinase
VAALKLIINELHYELLRKISEGGMGIVYEAHQYGAGNFLKLVAIISVWSVASTSW